MESREGVAVGEEVGRGHGKAQPSHFLCVFAYFLWVWLIPHPEKRAGNQPQALLVAMANLVAPSSLRFRSVDDEHFAADAIGDHTVPSKTGELQATIRIRGFMRGNNSKQSFSCLGIHFLTRLLVIRNTSYQMYSTT